MRAGPELFLIKDFMFYDTMATAVLGTHTIATYEVMRRFVWRDQQRGKPILQRLVGQGQLVTTVKRQTLVEYTGLSISTVKRSIKKLRQLRWVEELDQYRDGRAVVWDLGYRLKEGTEFFYADGDLRSLGREMERRAQIAGHDKLSELSLKTRLEIATEWFAEGRDTQLRTPWGFTQNPQTGHSEPSEGPERTPASVKYDKTVTEKDHNRERTKKRDAARPASSEADASEPSPPTMGRRGSRLNTRKPSKTRKPFTTKRPKRRNRVDSSPRNPGGGSLEERLATVAQVEKQTTEQLQEDQRIRELKEQEKARRRKATQRGLNDEARRDNLQGTPANRKVVAAAKRLWKVWRGVVSMHVAEDPGTPWFNEQGESGPGTDGKARNHAYELVRMYGEELVAETMQYVGDNWVALRERFYKGKDGGPPTMGFLFSFHESVFGEYKMRRRYLKVEKEWSDWYLNNPGQILPPVELRERYQKACEAAGIKN